MAKVENGTNRPVKGKGGKGKATHKRALSLRSIRAREIRARERELKKKGGASLRPVSLGQLRDEFVSRTRAKANLHLDNCAEFDCADCSAIKAEMAVLNPALEALLKDGLILGKSKVVAPKPVPGPGLRPTAT
jgi:hypothetical protein